LFILFVSCSFRFSDILSLFPSFICWIFSLAPLFLSYSFRPYSESTICKFLAYFFLKYSTTGTAQDNLSYSNNQKLRYAGAIVREEILPLTLQRELLSLKKYYPEPYYCPWRNIIPNPTAEAIVIELKLKKWAKELSKQEQNDGRELLSLKKYYL
jgi:hypothetical protein